MASIRLKNLMAPPLTKTFGFGVSGILEVVDCAVKFKARRSQIPHRTTVLSPNTYHGSVGSEI